MTAIDLDLGGHSIGTNDRARRFERTGRSRGSDWFELLVVGLFGLLAAWVLAIDLWDVVVHGQVWTGTDGIFSEDQLQYLAWIRDASQHVLVSNMFVLTPTRADYLQPMVAISGGLVALGVAPWVALLAWKPVALAVVFFATRGLVHRTARSRAAREPSDAS